MKLLINHPAAKALARHYARLWARGEYVNAFQLSMVMQWVIANGC